MPYQWLPTEGDQRRLHLWPHQSLPRTGFVWFIGGTVAVIAIPMLVLIGSPALWGMLPFFGLVIWGVWAALMRSYRDGAILEALTLDPRQTSLTRDGPHGAHHAWHANTHWVQAVLHPTGGPVPNYLTLRGGPREVEIGRFLSEDERLALLRDLQRIMAEVAGRA